MTLFPIRPRQDRVDETLEALERHPVRQGSLRQQAHASPALRPQAPVQAHPQTRARDPFTAAAEDLSIRWSEMESELATTKGELEESRAENATMSADRDRLARELHQTRAFYETENTRLRERADRATDHATGMVGKFSIIITALQAVIDEHQKFSQQQQSQHRSHVDETIETIVAEPSELEQFTEVPETEAAQVRGLLERLPQLSYPPARR